MSQLLYSLILRELHDPTSGVGFGELINDPDYKILMTPVSVDAEAMLRSSAMSNFDLQFFETHRFSFNEIASSDVALIADAASLGHSRALDILSHLARNIFLPEEFLFRCARLLHDNSNLVGTELLAAFMEKGRGYPRAIERSNRLWGTVLSRKLGSAYAGDRFAMFQVGDLYAGGVGVALDAPRHQAGRAIESAWQKACFWWLKASGSSRPFAHVPSRRDFPRKIDSIGSVAIARLAKAYEIGLGIEINGLIAVRLYAIAARAGSAYAAAELSAFLFREGVSWRQANEQQYGNKLIRRSDRWLSYASRKDSSRGSLLHGLRYQYMPMPADYEGQCSLDGTSLCSWGRAGLHRLSFNLKKAYEGGDAEAAMIIGLRLVLLMPGFTRTLVPDDVNTSDKLVIAACSFIKDAVRMGTKAVAGLEEKLYQQSYLTELFRLTNEFLSIAWLDTMSDFTQRTHRESSELMRAFCPVSYNRTLARVIQQFIDVDPAPVAPLWLDWLALRLKLADLEDNEFAAEWRQTLIVAQMRSDAFRQIADQVQPRKRRFSFVSAPDLKQAIYASTTDIGPVYNALDWLHVPVPYTLKQSSNEDERGWRQVESIELRDGKFRIVGEIASAGSPAFIFKEDVWVLFAVNYLDQMEPSFSLEPFDNLFDPLIWSAQFHRKVWYPDWLSESLLGKSFYYSDYLLGLNEKGRSLFSLSADPTKTAEHTRSWSLPQAWRLALRCGGTVSSPRGRLAHIPIAIHDDDWVRGPLRDDGRGNKAIRIPKVQAGVEGADWVLHQKSKTEDRDYGNGNPRFYYSRKAAVLTSNYNDMMAAFPVYRRTQALFGLHSGIWHARRNGIELSDPLMSRIAAFRDGLVAARNKRLSSGGLDVVLRA